MDRPMESPTHWPGPVSRPLNNPLGPPLEGAVRLIHIYRLSSADARFLRPEILLTPRGLFGYGFPSMAAKRHGITAAGNWIVDRVKTIDVWPQEERLAQILSESLGGGGGAHNVLVDLALMKAPFPLRATGVVGNDEDGK